MSFRIIPFQREWWRGEMTQLNTLYVTFQACLRGMSIPVTESILYNLPQNPLCPCTNTLMHTYTMPSSFATLLHCVFQAFRGEISPPKFEISPPKQTGWIFKLTHWTPNYSTRQASTWLRSDWLCGLATPHLAVLNSGVSVQCLIQKHRTHWSAPCVLKLNVTPVNVIVIQ